MRIILTWSENLNKEGAGRGHFVHLAQQLAARGHQVRILTPGFNPRTTEDLGVPITYLPVGRRSIATFLLFHLWMLLAMPWLILRYRPQVVYSRGTLHAFMIQAICRLMGVAYVAEINGIGYTELSVRNRPVQAALVDLVDRWNHRWASAFICVTEGMRQEMLRRGARPDRVFAIDNGAATEMFVPGDFRAARRELNLPQDAILIGFVGGLAAYQGLDLLIEAAALCPADHSPPIYYILVGGGERRAMVEEKIAEKGLQSRFILAGTVDHRRVPLYLEALDIEVISVYDERITRFGLSSLKFWEALSMGLPILVPDVTGLGKTLKELNWPAEYPTGDPQGLAKQILSTIPRLAECRQRRQELHAIMVREHSWAAVAGRVEEVLQRLLTPEKK